MKAICVHEFGGVEVLRLEEAPMPRPGLGQMLVPDELGAVGVPARVGVGLRCRSRVCGCLVHPGCVTSHLIGDVAFLCFGCRLFQLLLGSFVLMADHDASSNKKRED